eukprot:gnl/TRDRNA2_/TRDRNA2_51290_c0_seq1.p1 gnl/TRDRNA2_/TRDRNA2_51290_c0~~gnl/TRDRNA2_/TRDRNA2_51290_c0_seq1.p1  ORF type:complete len:483 (+),score=46.59 gnl/TRDRNA2_/TRDRNA2_51290_c0_seq1:130-1578(+)
MLAATEPLLPQTVHRSGKTFSIRSLLVGSSFTVLITILIRSAHIARREYAQVSFFSKPLPSDRSPTTQVAWQQVSRSPTRADTQDSSLTVLTRISDEQDRLVNRAQIARPGQVSYTDPESALLGKARKKEEGRLSSWPAEIVNWPNVAPLGQASRRPENIRLPAPRRAGGSNLTKVQREVIGWLVRLRRIGHALLGLSLITQPFVPMGSVFALSLSLLYSDLNGVKQRSLPLPQQTARTFALTSLALISLRRRPYVVMNSILSSPEFRERIFSVLYVYVLVRRQVLTTSTKPTPTATTTPTTKTTAAATKTDKPPTSTTTAKPSTPTPSPPTTASTVTTATTTTTTTATKGASSTATTTAPKTETATTPATTTATTTAKATTTAAAAEKATTTTTSTATATTTTTKATTPTTSAPTTTTTATTTTKPTQTTTSSATTTSEKDKGGGETTSSATTASEKDKGGGEKTSSATTTSEKDKGGGES